MKEIKYYHLRRNLTDEKPLDFVSLDNAYDFLVGFFTDKQAKLWHCDGIEDSAEPTPKEWVKAVMEEIGQIEFEIITGEGEHYDLWLSEKELRLADDGIAGAFKPKTAPVLEDPNKDIFEYWKKLSQTGDAEVQNNLALMYYGGNGTEKDEEVPDELEAAVRIHVKRIYEKYDCNLTRTAEALKAARNTVKKYLEN